MKAFRCAACGAINRIPAEHAAGRPVCGRCQAALDTSGKPQEVDAEGLARAVRSSPVPVLVDFWAPWCGPCRAAAPVLEGLAQRRAGELLVLKLNTEDHPEAGQAYGIRSIPTFVLAREGREVSRQMGLPPGPALERWVDGASSGRDAQAGWR